MNVIDPVADMLTRVRNACQAGHRRVDMPVSKLKLEIARILRDNHYIQDFKALDDGRHGLLRLYLKYHNDAPVIRELVRSEEHTSELQSQSNLVCRLLLEKKKHHTLKHT